MAKKKKGKSANINVMYNRPSRGMQLNYARQDFKEAGISELRKKDSKKIVKWFKVTAILWVVLTALITYLYGVIGLLDGLFIGVVAAASWLIYINKLDRDIIMAYLRLEIPKDAYLKEIAKTGVNGKRLAKISKMWDKAEKKAKPKSA